MKAVIVAITHPLAVIAWLCVAAVVCVVSGINILFGFPVALISLGAFLFLAAAFLRTGLKQNG